METSHTDHNLKTSVLEAWQGRVNGKDSAEPFRVDRRPRASARRHSDEMVWGKAVVGKRSLSAQLQVWFEGTSGMRPCSSGRGTPAESSQALTASSTVLEMT